MTGAGHGAPLTHPDKPRSEGRAGLASRATTKPPRGSLTGSNAKCRSATALRGASNGAGCGRSCRVDAPLGDRRRTEMAPGPARVSAHMKRMSTQVRLQRGRASLSTTSRDSASAPSGRWEEFRFSPRRRVRKPRSAAAAGASAFQDLTGRAAAPPPSLPPLDTGFVPPDMKMRSSPRTCASNG